MHLCRTAGGTAAGRGASAVDRFADLLERALGGARADFDRFLRAVEIEPADVAERAG